MKRANGLCLFILFYLFIYQPIIHFNDKSVWLCCQMLLLLVPLTFSRSLFDYLLATPSHSFFTKLFMDNIVAVKSNLMSLFHSFSSFIPSLSCLLRWKKPKETSKVEIIYVCVCVLEQVCKMNEIIPTEFIPPWVCVPKIVGLGAQQAVYYAIVHTFMHKLPPPVCVFISVWFDESWIKHFQYHIFLFHLDHLHHSRHSFLRRSIKSFQ